MRYYRDRLCRRVGEDAEEVDEVEKRKKRGGEEWMPRFE
jgi:hypothetical protein